MFDSNISTTRHFIKISWQKAGSTNLKQRNLKLEVFLKLSVYTYSLYP